MKKEYKNNIFLDAFAGEKLDRPPVWMMRQAGRYLPDFRKLREKYSFFERIETPELAAEITIMPVKQIGVDVAILFSDILVVPQALDFKIEISENKGPQILNSINTPEDALKLKTTGHVAAAKRTIDSVHRVHTGLNPAGYFSTVS